MENTAEHKTFLVAFCVNYFNEEYTYIYIFFFRFAVSLYTYKVYNCGKYTAKQLRDKKPYRNNYYR